MGVFSLVLEGIPAEVAEIITQKITVPTIGIGSGPHCDGQVLVTTDLWATSLDYIPRHAQPNMQVPIEMRQAVCDWMKSFKTIETQELKRD